MLISKQVKNSILSYSTRIVLLIIFQVIYSHITKAQCNNKILSFKDGEKLTYNVYYKLGFVKIKLADVMLWVEETTYHSKSVFLLQNKSITVPQYAWIIKANNYYASYIDKNTMEVERHIQKTLVNDYSTNYEYRFDHQRKKLYVSIENSKTKRYLDTLSLTSCVHDLLSSAYYPRNIDYKKIAVNEKIHLPVILDTNFHNVYYKYMGNEFIDTKNKKQLNCIKIAPLLVKTAIYSAGEKMTVWLSNDKNKVPVLMESELRVGEISVQIIDYKGLQYPAVY